MRGGLVWIVAIVAGIALVIGVTPRSGRATTAARP